MPEHLPPTDEEKRSQSAAGVIAILVLVGAACLVTAFWRDGFAGARDLVAWAWDSAVLTPLSWLSDSEFWFNSLTGFLFIILLTFVIVRVCGSLSILSVKGLSEFFYSRVKKHVENRIAPATSKDDEAAQKVRVEQLAGLGAFWGTAFCLGIAALLLSIPLVWFLSWLDDFLLSYRIAVLMDGNVPARYTTLAVGIFIGLLICFVRRD